MKSDNTRRLLILFTLLYFGVAFFIPVYAPFLEDLYFSSFTWEQALVIRATLAGIAALSSFSLWMFCRDWIGRRSRGLAGVIVMGLLLPAVIVEVSRELARSQRRRAQILDARIKNEAHLISMEDEELVSEGGHPVGVRLRYKVHYPEGGEIIRRASPATLSTAPLPYVMGFGVLKKDLRALNSTDYVITVDLLPDFMPRAIVFPGSSSDPGNLCFNWRSVASGPWGDSSRAAVLDTPPQNFRIDLGTPRLSAPTHGTNHLRRFYEGAKQEGAKECS
jgi:hypothetical protein